MCQLTQLTTPQVPPCPLTNRSRPDTSELAPLLHTASTLPSQIRNGAKAARFYRIMLANHLAQHDETPDSRTLLSARVHALPGSQPHHLPTTTLRSLQLLPPISGSTTSSYASSGPGSPLNALSDHCRHSGAPDLQLEPDLDDATRLSLQRATKILRASERAREMDKHRSSSSLRWREPVFVVESLPIASCSARPTVRRVGIEHLRETNLPHTTSRPGKPRSTEHFGPKELLLRPALSKSTDVRRTSGSPKALSPSPPRLGLPRHLSAAAAGEARGRVTSKDRLSRRKPAGPADVAPVTLRAHDPQPQPRPSRTFMSKESLVHPATKSAGVEASDASLREDALAPAGSFERTTGDGSKSLRTKFGRRASRKSSDSLAVKKKSSLASLFGFVSGNDSSASEIRRPRAPAPSGIDASFTQHPLSSSGTSGHRPSTSLSSYAPSTSTSGSALGSRGSSRLRFFRSLGRRKSGASPISNTHISAPSLLSPSRRQPPPSAAGITNRAELPPVPQEDTTWRARFGRAIQGKNVAAKRALFEKNTQDSLLRAAYAGTLVRGFVLA